MERSKEGVRRTGGVTLSARSAPASGRPLEIEVGAIAAEIAGFARWPQIAARPAVAVIPHSARHAERQEPDEESEHHQRPEVHQWSSGNTSDLTTTGTTPLGATGAPTSM